MVQTTEMLNLKYIFIIYLCIISFMKTIIYKQKTLSAKLVKYDLLNVCHNVKFSLYSYRTQTNLR